MLYVELVAIAAVFQFLFFGAMVGLERRKSGLKGPKVTGDEGFERMYRVQMNTLEMLVAFMPALFIAAKYWPPTITASIGAVYIIGRLIYWRAYVTNPASRGLGFKLTIAPIALLIFLSCLGILMSLIAPSTNN